MNKLSISELEQKIKRMQKELAIANANLWNTKLKRVERVYGVTTGSIVIGEGREYRVHSIDIRWKDKPWLKGYGKKKDGTWSVGLRNLYDNWQGKG